MSWLIPLTRKPKSSLSDEVLGNARKKSAIANITEKFGVKSLVAYGAVFDGNFMSKDGIAVDGTLNGDITVGEVHRAVLVRQGGVVNGVINAPIVVVGGEVNGDINAQHVRLYPTAIVYGKVNSSRLIVDDGARIINEHFTVGERPQSATINVVGFPAVQTPVLSDGVVASMTQ